MSHLITPTEKPKYKPPEFPLWFSLSKESKEALRRAQKRNHKKELVPPPDPRRPVSKDLVPETLEEIEKVMRDNKDVAR